ncbi:MAG: hypothetical protein ACOY0T_20260 [Myxococcota bacterium]
MPSSIRDGFLLTKSDVEALCAFAGSDERRPDLTHIAFEPSGGRVYASDGCTLVRITMNRSEYTQSDAPLRFGVPRKTLKERARAMRAAERLSVCRVEGDIEIGVRESATGELVVTRDRFELDPELALPDYEQAIPEHRYEQRGASSAFNAEFLARLVLVQRACQANGLDFFAPLAPLAGTVFEGSNAQASWLAVVMPFRSERAHALSRHSSRSPPHDELSPAATRSLSVPLFRRLVERLAVLSVAEITSVEQMLATFATCKPGAPSLVAETFSPGGST